MEKLLTEKCSKHKDKVIEVLCVDHDQLICSTCALLEHRKCETLKHITDSLEELEGDPDIQDVPERLKTALYGVEQAIVMLEQYEEKLSERERECLDEIEQFTIRILAKVELLKQSAKTLITTKHKQLATEVRENKQVACSVKVDLIENIEHFRTMRKRKAHLFILAKKGQLMTKKAKILCTKSENIVTRLTKLAFRPNRRIENILNDNNMVGTEEAKYTTSLNGTVYLRVNDDSGTCNIQACCLLHDGTLVLADENNGRLKHVSSIVGVITHINVSGCLCGVTRISPGKVAVAIGRSGNLQIVSIGKKITCTGEINLNHSCYRATHDNGELYVTDKCVFVHNMKGELIRTISENEAGETIFGNVKDIAINNTGDKIYVADMMLGLVCLNREGYVLFKLSENELGLSGAHGLCTDHAGNVLVCGYRSNSVVQVTEDGSVIGKILTVSKPQCMCYDDVTHVLYVAGKSDRLLVYKLI